HGLLHDPLPRGAADGLARALRGGAHGRRERVPALLERHAARHPAHDVPRDRAAHDRVVQDLRPHHRALAGRHGGPQHGHRRAVAVHLPAGLHRVEVRLRVIRRRRALRAVHRDDRHPVPHQQEAERLMSATRMIVLPHGTRADRDTRPAARVGRVVGSILLVAFALALLTPFFWMVMSSFKGPNEVFSVPVRWLPEVWHVDNYFALWIDTDMAIWLRNTIILSTVVTFLQVLTGSFAAYGFAKVRFPGRDVLFLLYLGTIAVPWQSYMIPQYVMMAQFKLTNTLVAMIVLQAFGAFGVFLMKQF